MAEEKKEAKNELAGWFAEVYIKDVILQEGSLRYWVTLEPVSPFKMVNESSCWTVFRRVEFGLDASGLLLEKIDEDDVVDARLFRSNSRFAVNGIIGNDALIKLKLSHTKLRVGLKDGTDDILRMDVI